MARRRSPPKPRASEPRKPPVRQIEPRPTPSRSAWRAMVDPRSRRQRSSNASAGDWAGSRSSATDARPGRACRLRHPTANRWRSNCCARCSCHFGELQGTASASEPKPGRQLDTAGGPVISHNPFALAADSYSAQSCGWRSRTRRAAARHKLNALRGWRPRRQNHLRRFDPGGITGWGEAKLPQWAVNRIASC